MSTPITRIRRALDQLLASSFGSRVVVDAPIGSLTTYRVGGRASALITVNSLDELAVLAEVVSRFELPTLVIGRGSNLLVSDAGFDGIALTLGDGFSNVQIDDRTVHAGGSVKLPVLSRATVNAGLTGFAWAVGVPGSLGGAVRMNAGGHGGDMSDSLVSATVVDLRSGSVETVDSTRLRFGYRTSSITEWQVVAEAELQLAPGDIDAGREEIAEIIRWRRANQPGGQNAGSVFTNPPGHSAGRLIEEAGAKGLRVGSAMVSERHANFIQADEGGSADDIFSLMSRVSLMVREMHGIELHAETHLVGFHGPLPGED